MKTRYSVTLAAYALVLFTLLGTAFGQDPPVIIGEPCHDGVSVVFHWIKTKCAEGIGSIIVWLERD